MKQVFAKHYDKLLLLTALLVLGVVFGFQLTQVTDFGVEHNPKESESAWARSSNGVFLETKLKNNLMPGTFIFYKTSDDNFSRIEISKLIFKRKAEVTIQLKDGKILNGKIKPKEGVVISQNWSNSTTPLLLDIDGRVAPVQMRTIKKIIGAPIYVLDDSADLTILRTKQPHFYQRITYKNFSSKSRKRPDWKKISSDRNNTVYELFTPPLIYLIDNELTTTLPEAPIEEEEKEPFGASIISFSEKPYRFRLTSWIGNSPYIEDSKLTEEFGRPIRNRLEVNKSYKLIEDPKPGRPSLTEVDNNSSEKLLSLKYFTVQNVTQKNGGVKSVGRALIEDHALGLKPFEINSIMENVFLGQFEVELYFKIGKEDPYQITLSQTDTGKEITYNGRNYTILDFDINRKSVKLRKANSIPNQFEEIELVSP